MHQPNRIKDYYETLVEFISLPVSARFLIGTHFHILRTELLAFGDKDLMDEEIIRGVFKHNSFEEFKKLTRRFAESKSHAYPH